MVNGYNLVANVLKTNTYVHSSGNIKSIPNEFLCIQIGLIRITPMSGDEFLWHAQPGEKINIMATKVEIVYGRFIAFFAFTSPIELLQEVMFLIDENESFIIDELNNKFVLE